MTAEEAGGLFGKWATGRIPTGTLVTPGLFETPPLSGSPVAGRVPIADKVLIQIQLPVGEAPDGKISTGETLALLGRERLGEQQSQIGAAPPLGLIGMLTLEYVDGASVFYIVDPVEALEIHDVIDRYQAASDRLIWKVSASVTADDITAALEGHADDASISSLDLGERLESAGSR